jgi:hypothetical protein
MPAISDRAKLLQELDYVLIVLAADGKEESADFQEILEIRYILSQSRCLNPKNTVPKSTALEQMMFQYSDREFRIIARCDKASFIRLAGDLENSAVYIGNSNRKQKPIWIQVMMTLTRLGCEGNGASIGATGIHWGKSYGTVINYTERTLQAILARKDVEIRWPSADERRAISRRFDANHGMKGCVGVVDGTHVNFFQRPAVDGEVFFNRKQRYSMNVQLVCDDKRRIIYHQVGWPGSVYDATVFSNSHLYRNPAEYFSLHEFLLGDAGFAANFFMLTPYRQPAASLAHNQLYNVLLSSPRQVIEHVNGLLKGRFQSLKGIRIQIKKKEDFKNFVDWIVACLVLHNMFLRYNDSWEDEDNEDEDVAAAAAEDPAPVPDATGQDLRMRMQHYLLTWYHERV